MLILTKLSSVCGRTRFSTIIMSSATVSTPAAAAAIGAATVPAAGRFPRFPLSPLPLRLLITAWVLTLILLGFLVTFTLQCVVWLLTLPIASNQRFRLQALGGIFRIICSFVSRLNPFWSVRFEGSLPATRPDRVIVMSNHVSNLDPFITCRALLPWETKYISKASLFNVPFGGWAMRMAGDIPVYFTAEKGGWGLKKGSVAVLMETCRQYVADLNIPITVFPEGTRSGSTVLKEFKPGMFNFAVENDCYILPMAMIGTHKAWPVWTATLDKADIAVRLGELIPPITNEQLSKEEKVALLMKTVRQHIEKLIQQLQNHEKHQ
jgi:1-acyl-sn-glycerol-3-phosphate acyltransferase